MAAVVPRPTPTPHVVQPARPDHKSAPLNTTAAKASLRRFAIERLEPDELAAEMRQWSRQRALLLADLAAEDFTDTDADALRGGIAYAEARLVELDRQAERHLRARAQPGYPSAQTHDDLGPRFAAAKWADAVGLIETLTGQSAVKTGNGRYRIRCPWHEDRHPSLVIYPPGRGWWCPVCHKAGDVVAFVAEFNHCAAVEALRFVETLTDTCPAAGAIAS
jgi:hypothetical protein